MQGGQNKIMQATAESAAKAEQVFETTELMEEIFMSLNTRDTLRAMQVNRAMRNCVLGSNKLQKHVGLLPNYDADFSALPWADAKNQTQNASNPGAWNQRFADSDTFHGFSYCNYNGTYCCLYDTRFDDLLQIGPDPRKLRHAGFIAFTRDNRTLERLGTRTGQLSVCQPPLQQAEIEYRFEHCHDPYDKIPDPAAVLRPSNGSYITMGDLSTAVLETRKRHRLKCKKGDEKANCCVEIHGQVKLRKQDAIMLQRQDKRYAERVYGWEDWLDHSLDHEDEGDAQENGLENDDDESYDDRDAMIQGLEDRGHIDPKVPNMTWHWRF